LEKCSDANPITEPPDAHGWKTTEENQLQAVRFVGPQSPSKLSSVVADDNCVIDEEIEDEDDEENGSYAVA